MRWLVAACAVPVLAFSGCGSKGPRQAPPRGGKTAVRFTDITGEAGINFRQRHGGCGKAYFVEQTGAGVALFDAEGDGDLDLYFPQATWLPGCGDGKPLRPQLYLNDGKARFTEVPNAGGAVTSDYGIGAASADYDDDGRTDLFVSCYGRSHLFHNEGGARFKDVTASSGIRRDGYSTSVAWLDYDRDGRLDVFVCGYVEWDPSAPVRCPAEDGRPDYCTPEAFQPAHNALYRNRGGGKFEDVTRKAGLFDPPDRGLGVVAADFDGDGWLDLFVANDNGANRLYRNQKNGAFQNEAMQRAVAFGASGGEQSNMGLAPGDYDGDGDLDILVTTFANEPFTLYRNDGDFFTDTSADTGLAEATYLPLGFGTNFFDADGDGRLDLFFANGHVEQYISQRSQTQTFAQANQLFLNRDGTGFVEAKGVLPVEDVRVHRASATGDLDGDGDLDLVITALDDRPTILRNDTPARHWLIVEPRAKERGDSVIGAIVRVETGGVTQSRWVVGGGSYLCQSEYAAHFGLGDHIMVDVQVTWPNGETQRTTQVKANQRLVVVRGAGSPSTQVSD